MYTDKIVLDWDGYEKMVGEISKMIIADHPDYKNIGIIGIARGGLAILTSVSYQLKTNKIGVIQISMSDDNCEYNQSNTARLIGEFYQKDISEYVIVEDILVTGKTIEEACKRLEANGKKLIGVYSLYLVDDFSNKYLEDKNIKISACVRNERDAWIEFPWDKELV